MASMFGSWLGERVGSEAGRRLRMRLGVRELETRLVPAIADFTAVAGGAGSGIVQVNSSSTQQSLFQILPFGSGFGTSITVATADVTGDGNPAIVTATGPGAPGTIRVYDGQTGQQLAGTIGSFFPFGASYTGGLNVAAGDLTGDSRADIVVGEETGDLVKVFDGATGALINTFDAYDSSFLGGVRVAVGDVEGLGRNQVITGAGPGADPHVQVLDLGTAGTSSPTVDSSFDAFDSGFVGGVFVAAGKINGTGKGVDLAVGAGPGAGPAVVVLNGGNLTGTPLASFYAYDTAFTGGVRVSIGNIPDVGPGVITTSGTGALPDTEYWAPLYTGTYSLRAAYYGAPSGDGGYVAATGTTSSASLTTGVENLYVFNDPSTSTPDTELVLTASAFAGNGTSTIFEPNTTYTIHVDNSDVTNPTDDIDFQISFGAPDANGTQTASLVENVGGVITVLATGTPNSIAAFSSGSGQFFAGTVDDPAFEDKTGIDEYAAGTLTTLPRDGAVNYYGPDANTLAMVIDIPTSQLLAQVASPNPDIAVWATGTTFGVQTSRVGKSNLIRDLLIPTNLQSQYDSTSPSTDAANFTGAATTILTNAPYNLTTAQAQTILASLLPDVLVFDTTTAFTTDSTDSTGFPNGRRLRDDSASYLLNLLTNGAVTTDGVADDNGDKITDGTLDTTTNTFRSIQFPFVGYPGNASPAGPNLN